MVKLKFKKRLFGAEEEFELDINLKIKRGEFVVVTGKSGSGKTTLLRVIAGLESAEGKIEVDGVEWLGKRALPPQKREVGFMFQDYALFENMTVLGNLLFASKDKELADYLLNVTELTKLKDRYPKSLSGGQKQRVALCRALMRRPKLFLLDEPLSALDFDMRLKLQEEIKTLHKEFKMTTVMVSHDKAEIFRVSSRVLVLDGGKIISDLPKSSLVKSSKKLLAEVVEVDGKKAYILLCGELFEIENKDFSVGDEVELNLGF